MLHFVLNLTPRIVRTTKINDSDGHPYNSKERRAIREKNRAPPTSHAANYLTVKDPETGKEVKGDIIGVNPTRRKWLGVALPSNNPNFPGLSRGLWVNCSSGTLLDGYRDYVAKGANHQIRAAADGQILEDCKPEQFELNIVFQMPWGKAWHTHGYGIPHYQQDREFMLFSNSMLTTAWGTTDTSDLLHTHMQDAGQSIMTKAGERRIKAKAWRK